MDAISKRITRLNSIILGHPDNSAAQKELYEGLNREGLLDALFALYHECNKDALKKKNKSIADFEKKYRTIIKEAKNLRVNLNDFDIKTQIGSGYFGDVHLVSDKHSNDVYAMKKIKKAMVNSFQVKEERDIMVMGRKSEWLTTLQYAFQDKDHLYLVMEYLPGGDLLSLMIRNGAFEERLAKFYLAELTLALNALHQLGFVHRDIKPENILLDRFGHLKLADFGSAISLNEDGCFTNISPVGTPDYIAPELLQILSTKGTASQQKLDASCDFWSMGVIGYEMITEKTPFHSANLYETYNEIQHYLDEKRLVHPLDYPENVRVSKNFRDFLNGLITKRSLRLSFEEIQEHPFFHGIKWHNLRDQTPMIIPSISGEDDTSNFEDVDKSLKRSPMLKKQTYTPIRVNEFSGEDLSFLGYTYAYEESSNASKLLSKSISKTSEAALESRLSTKIKDLQTTIKEQMREIKDLQKDLLSTET